jgi:predicted aspartyl protease
MKTQLLALALGALCTSAASRDADSNVSTAGVPVAADGAQPLTIPTAADRSGRILARVFVNGRGPYRFMVDTGASHTALAASLLPELGISVDRTRA